MKKKWISTTNLYFFFFFVFTNRNQANTILVVLSSECCNIKKLFLIIKRAHVHVTYNNEFVARKALQAPILKQAPSFIQAHSALYSWQLTIRFLQIRSQTDWPTDRLISIVQLINYWFEMNENVMRWFLVNMWTQSSCLWVDWVKMNKLSFLKIICFFSKCSYWLTKHHGTIQAI